MKKKKPQPILLKDYKPSDYIIETVKLDVSLHPTETRVKAKLRIKPNPVVTGTHGPLILDGDNIKLEKVAIGGKALDKKAYKATKTSLKIVKPPSRAFTLDIITTCNPEKNKALSGLYRSGSIYCTQCEAQGFRRITYYLDRPDVLSVFTTRIEADKEDAPILLSNGNLIDSGDTRKKGRHFATWHDPHPKPAYLFALVGGDLAEVSDTFKTKSGRVVNLKIFVEHGKEDRCEWAMSSLKRSMKWDEKRFGLEYDLDIFNLVAVSDFNMGAMENKSLNVFNDKLVLADPNTATDGNYEAIEAVIAHEYFHNWTGNRITCRDWFQLCLKEGLTVFRDQEFSSDERSRTVSRIQNVRLLRSHQFPEDGGPLAHPVRPDSYIEINNFYTATVYEKGAELCRMIMTMVGEEGFRKGMDLYIGRHDGEAATVEDFISSMAEANEIDLDQFMLWYSQAGTPQVMAKMDYNKRKQEATLTFTQAIPKTPGQSSKKPHHMPVKLGLIDKNGKDIKLKVAGKEPFSGDLLHLTKREQKVTFSGIKEKPTPSLFRGFSAPIQLNMSQSEKDLEFLAGNDSDLFNRWQASQTYATDLLVQLEKIVASGKKSRKGAKLAKILSNVLQDDALEPAYKAEFISLPTEGEIARQIGQNVNTKNIHNAKHMLLSGISKDIQDELLEAYKKHANKGKYTATANSVGKRSLRNQCLNLLAASGNKEITALVVDHYKKAKNMTDKMAALGILTHSNSDEREEIFCHFYEEFKDDHLVLDKWFSLQAMSSSDDTIEKIRALKKHPKFSLKTPNRVRALIAFFAQSNTMHFNCDSGEGYRLVAETVLELDSFNPQIAARLCGAFRSWRIMEPNRQKQAKKQLEIIAGHKKLSKDTYEIVTKTLG